MANRQVTAEDKLLFNALLIENELPELKDIDFIIDAPTINQTNKFSVTRLNTDPLFKNLKLDAEGNLPTLWLHASKLQGFVEFTFSNESNKDAFGKSIPWIVPGVNIRVIPDEQLVFNVAPNTYGSHCFKIHGMKRGIISGYSKKFKGWYGWSSSKKFARDLFGLVVDSDKFYANRHLFYVMGTDDSDITIEGIAGGGGSFSFIRRQADGRHGVARGKLINCYGYGTDSETEYDGNTKGGPWFGLKDWEVRDVFYSRSGSESYQIQHLQGGAKIGPISCFNAAVRYPYAFQRYQDGCLQLSVDNGNNFIKSILIDGFASGAMTFFGGAPYSGTGGTVTPPIPGEEMVIETAYVRDGARVLYLHNSCSRGMTWRIKNLYVRDIHNKYCEVTGERIPDHYIDHAGTDKVIIEKLYHDGSRPKILSNNAEGKVTVLETILDPNIPKPIYAKKQISVVNWTQYVANYHPIADNTLMSFKIGDYVFDDEEGFPRVVCKAITNHLATATRPKNDHLNFIRISWDSNGIASDEPGWNENLPQRSYPPDDFRQTQDSPWRHLGLPTEDLNTTALIEELKAEVKSLKDTIATKDVLLFDAVQKESVLNNTINEYFKEIENLKSIILEKEGEIIVLKEKLESDTVLMSELTSNITSAKNLITSLQIKIDSAKQILNQ